MKCVKPLAKFLLLVYNNTEYIIYNDERIKAICFDLKIFLGQLPTVLKS